MDIEIDGLVELGGNPEPSPATVERHLRQLRAATTTEQPILDLGRERSNGDIHVADPADRRQPVDVALPELRELSPQRPPHATPRPRRPRPLAVAAVVAALVGAAAVTVAGPDGDDTRTSSSVGPTIDPVCGSELPIAIDPGSKYEGPFSGGVPGTSEALDWGLPWSDEPSAGQLALYWTTSTGGIEIRWPANNGPVGPTPPPSIPPPYSFTVTWPLDGFEPPCDHIQVAVIDEEWSRVEQELERITARFCEPVPREDCAMAVDLLGGG